MNTLLKLKTEFLEHLEIEKNRSKLTLRSYNHYLSRFLAFAENQGATNPASLDLDLVRRYRLRLNRLKDKFGREMKLATQNYHIIALRSFLKYLAKRDVKTIAAEKIELASIPARQVEFLESGDFEKLLKGPDKEREELPRLRGKAILELLFSTGLRVQELVNLKRNQIDLKKDEVPVRGKGGKLRIVFLSDAAKAALKNYLASRRDNSEALFTRQPRNADKTDILEDAPLTARSVQRLVKKYALLTGISPHVTPHTLRHSMATDLLTAGADLRSVQEILGHSSIVTTQIYTHITNKRLKEVHKKYHGRFRKNQ